jgi:trehalose-6-phosphatase
VSSAIYAGDDRTDLDAFHRLRQLREQGELDTAICVGVVSAEGPAELPEESDLTVEGPGGWLAMLESLAS